MTPEQEEDILAHASWLNGTKYTWNTQELYWAYSLYNALTGQKKKDTGCPSCRREVISYLKKKYEDLTTPKL